MHPFTYLLLVLSSYHTCVQKVISSAILKLVYGLLRPSSIIIFIVWHFMSIYLWRLSNLQALHLSVNDWIAYIIWLLVINTKTIDVAPCYYQITFWGSLYFMPSICTPGNEVENGDSYYFYYFRFLSFLGMLKAENLVVFDILYTRDYAATLWSWHQVYPKLVLWQNCQVLTAQSQV